MQPTILTYNLGAKQFQMELLCANLGVKIRNVKVEEQCFVVESIVENRAPQPTAEKATFADEMLVFCHFSDELLEQFLQLMRKVGIEKITLKAVLTPTNRKWNSVALHHELYNEYKALNK